jgi:outer membrane protein OmpA-like peptidoglycan-associated protein
MTRSNALAFRIVNAPPLQDVGWEVRVLSYQDFETRRDEDNDGRPLAVISKFREVSISPELGGTGSGAGLGAGSLTLDLDAEFWKRELTDGSPATSLLEYEHVYQVFEDGALRFEFLGQTLSKDWLPDNDGLVRTVTIAGPSIAAVLTWGSVMTPQYPNPAPADGSQAGTFQFKRTPLMSAWLQLLAAVQKRGTLGWIVPTFTHTHDSAGEPWEDTPPAVIDPAIATTTLAADVNFAVDSSTLTAAGLATIATICSQFTGHPAPRITCVGHTDSTASVAYNQTLSENRAASVRTRILQLVPQAIVTTYGRSELQPIATNATSAGRARNRRVTITYPAGVPAPPYEPVVEPPLGINLLDLLKEWSGEDRDQPAPIRVEWMVRPGFKLDVRRQFGHRRDNEVIFYEASTHTMSKQWERRRDQIANLIAVQNDSGEYSIATNAASITRWRQREKFSRQPNTYNEPARGAIAASMLELHQDERSTLTLKVPPYATGRRIFVDYDLGDWIGVSRFMGAATNVVERFRVIAVTLRVGPDNVVDLELTLHNAAEVYAQRLQARITSLLNHLDPGTKVWISDALPVNARVGDLWTPYNEQSL